MIFEGATPESSSLWVRTEARGEPTGGGAVNASVRYPATRMGVEDVISRGVTMPRLTSGMDAYAAKKSARDGDATRRDLQLEALIGGPGRASAL